MLKFLEQKRLIFVTGKGGVGKSMTSAGLANALARTGKNVLMVETDTYSAFGELENMPATEIKRVKISERVTAVNLRAEACLIETLTRYLPSRRVVKTLISNRVTKAFFDSAPSVNEFVLLDQILIQSNTASEYDVVLVDLPASGHAVTFLTVPQTLNSMMRGLGPIAKRAQEIDKTLKDANHTALVAVCLPEEMPVNETVELAAMIEEKLGRPLDVVVANMVHDAPVGADRLDAVRDAVKKLNGADTDVARVVRANGLAVDWFTRDHHYLDVLEEASAAPVVHVPMVYENDPKVLLDAITDHISTQIW